MEHIVPNLINFDCFVPSSYLCVEHIVPKLIKKDCFIPILLSVNGIYCSEIGHYEQVLELIVLILYLLKEYFVPKVVFWTFLFRGPICVWNIMFPNSSARIKVRTVLFPYLSIR